MRIPLSASSFESATARYAAALLVTTIVFLIRLLLNPIFGDYLPYITFFPAIAFSAWFCGTGPSILSVVVTILAARYWFIAPTHAFSLPHTAQSLGIVFFVFASSVIIALGEANRRSAERVRTTRKELEAQVQQRTIELNTANKQLRELTGHVLHLQDAERRRIARELHDSAGQSLAVLAISLSRIETDTKKQIESLAKLVGSAADSAALVNEIITTIRSVSYLLHPPMLDEAGLAPALRWFIEGFAERSKIAVDLDLSSDFGRLPQDFETAIFRVVQECLTNILRHSESQVARVSIARSANDVRIEVRDQGKGISPEKLSEMGDSPTLGVGLRGMRERIRQLGGILELSSDGAGKGTLVTVQLPVASSVALAASSTADHRFSYAENTDSGPTKG